MCRSICLFHFFSLFNFILLLTTWHRKMPIVFYMKQIFDVQNGEKWTYEWEWQPCRTLGAAHLSQKCEIYLILTDSFWSYLFELWDLICLFRIFLWDRIMVMLRSCISVCPFTHRYERIFWIIAEKKPNIMVVESSVSPRSNCASE